ncbi:hypothetical protein RHSIM_Rhsim11G0004600 [Rhododendron simsii]|uniref:Uncharacterized protein n=1 Tax=Rhododendron simsii TaxID=118357 RepID=A0A834LAK3_RHOSS|nr:hypothetical protein RHSIM_Rhsim11G0004600 [Rhododendron simsii]
MPKDGKIYVKPQSLAQKKMTGYDKVKQERMERNNKIMNALGLKSIPYPFCSSQPTKEGKSNVDGDESYEDFHLPTNVERLHFSNDDDEVHGSLKKKFWGCFQVLQPDSTTSQLQPSPNIVQIQATTGTPPRIVTKKFPRNRAGAMTATLQPSPSQLPPLPLIDQMQPPTANNQPQPPPTVRKKQSCWPVGAIAETLQPVPPTSQLQPSPNIVQAQPTIAMTPPIVTKKLNRSRVGAMAATLQPLPSQLPQLLVINQMQPSTATNQPQPPPIVTQKVPRRPIGAMAGTSQPSPTTSQM